MSDLKDMSTEMYRAWEQSMTKWWDAVLDDPQFIKGMGDNLSMQSRTRKGYEDQVDKAMESMHLPSRKDVVRLARIASLLEDKVLGLEDTLLDQSDALGRVEKESLQARVDAAEALVTVQERLQTIDAKLDALTDAVAALAEAPKKSTRSRSRKSSAKKSTAKKSPAKKSPAKKGSTKADDAADSEES